MKFNLKKLALALGSLAIVGAAAPALAVPQFTINPSAIPGTTNAPFVADFISGITNELLTVNGNHITGDGYFSAQSFSLMSNNVSMTGLNNSYGLYLSFHIDATGGTSLGSVDALNALSFTVYADPLANTHFTQAATSGNTFTPASATNTSDDIVLGNGTLISGTAGFDSLGGVFINALQSFAVCSGGGTANVGGTPIVDPACASNIGTSFFSQPVPFYSVAFDEFNNTTQGVSRTTDGTHIAITQASGGVDFVIPEPSTVALFGIATVGLALSAKRRSKSK